MDGRAGGGSGGGLNERARLAWGGFLNSVESVAGNQNCYQPFITRIVKAALAGYRVTILATIPR